MTEMNFVDRVKMYFSFLEIEFGFRTVSETNSAVRPETNGSVEYMSDQIGILIDCETGYIGVQIYRPEAGKKYYITPVDIHEFLITSDEEKKLLMSTKPENKVSASTLFKEKFLLNQPGWQGSRGSIQDLDTDLRNFSSWMKEHAYLYLEGELSLWIKLYEYKVHRARADHIRRGENELEYAQIKDSDGKWKLIKQPIFKDELEHIEKLKKELSV